MKNRTDLITPQQAENLHGLFKQRVDRCPDRVAYRFYDSVSRAWRDLSWRAVSNEVDRWKLALYKEGLQPGDRVGVMLANSPEWVMFDQAALALGLVTVPLYINDRPDNVSYIGRNAGLRLIFIEGGRHSNALSGALGELPDVQRIVCRTAPAADELSRESRLVELAQWLSCEMQDCGSEVVELDDLATIVYTSGTTGPPKGVMLSHRNILDNAYAASQCLPELGSRLFLSFLPLSHSLERTGGCYVPMMGGATVAYARSISHIAEDLVKVRPSVLMSVPRVYEMFYNKVRTQLETRGARERLLFEFTARVGWRRFEHSQGRAGWSPLLMLWPMLDRLVARKVLAHMGGRIVFAVCGGAALPPQVGRFFLSLGLPLYQGYGMTEASPVVSVNRVDDNVPDSIGTPLPGIEVRIGDQEELLTRSTSVMKGYWQNPEASAAAVDGDGWLHTGDQARLDESGHLYITGRLKDIIVLGNGEKVPPADMEMAILQDPLFDQVMLVGEGRAFLALLAVLNSDQWERLAKESGLKAAEADALKDRQVHRAVLTRIAQCLNAFPGYAQVRQVHLTLSPWTMEDGLITPTLKIRRPQVVDRYAEEIEALYAGYR